jgi:putative (di)nucleoside polyphosphate hydrolase
MTQYFRAGVVVVVRRVDDGRVLAFERVDTPGSWQLPQGGIESGETPTHAAWRELHEETALDADHVALVETGTHWILYQWPDEVRATDRGRRHPDCIGQVQLWFRFDVHSGDVEPRPDGREFSAWRWVEPAWLVGHVVDWRRDAYAEGLARWL